MTVEKPKPKQLLRPITTGAGSAMNQSQFLAITCNSLEAREKSRVHGAIGFAFDSHWLKNWREYFKPITKRSNRNHVYYFRQSFENCSIQLNILVLLLMLNWKNHIDELCLKLSKTVGVVSKLRYYVNIDVLKILDNYVIYQGVHIWGLTYPTYLNPLTNRQSVQSGLRHFLNP